MRFREPEIVRALEGLGGEASTLEIAEQAGLPPNSTLVTLGQMRGERVEAIEPESKFYKSRGNPTWRFSSVGTAGWLGEREEEKARRKRRAEEEKDRPCSNSTHVWSVVDEEGRHRYSECRKCGTRKGEQLKGKVPNRSAPGFFDADWVQRNHDGAPGENMGARA